MTLVGTVHGVLKSERTVLMHPAATNRFFEEHRENLSSPTTLLIIEGDRNDSDWRKLFSPNKEEYAAIFRRAFSRLPAWISCDLTVADDRGALFHESMIKLMSSIIHSGAVVIPEIIRKKHIEKKRFRLRTGYRIIRDRYSGLGAICKIDWELLAEKVFDSSKKSVRKAKRKVFDQVLDGCDQTIIRSIKRFGKEYDTVIVVVGLAHAQNISRLTGIPYVEVIPKVMHETAAVKARYTPEMKLAQSLIYCEPFYADAKKFCS
ncbi:MAG: hypothetical protein JWM20_106 [Patescibacteria group bacterium]|nr:hypothetical protein [Patescibacteria group bacterium]